MSPIAFASAITLSIIVMAIAPSISSVVAAFLLFGRLKAGTPLEIASTPVSAAQPDENARASRNNSAIVVMESSKPGAGAMSRRALSTSGRLPETSWSIP